MPRHLFKTRRTKTLAYGKRVEALFQKLEQLLKRPLRFTTKRSVEAFLFLILFFAFFGLLAWKMEKGKWLTCSS